MTWTRSALTVVFTGACVAACTLGVLISSGVLMTLQLAQLNHAGVCWSSPGGAPSRSRCPRERRGRFWRTGTR